MERMRTRNTNLHYSFVLYGLLKMRFLNTVRNDESSARGARELLCQGTDIVWEILMVHQFPTPIENFINCVITAILASNVLESKGRRMKEFGDRNAYPCTLWFTPRLSHVGTATQARELREA
jgi:hypothetical protein